jgi:hypothetical protein
VVLAQGGQYFPLAIALDGADNLYIANGFIGDIEELPAGGGAAIVLKQTNGLPLGIAVDSAGNVFAAIASESLIVELPRTQPPSMTFAASAIGAPSSDSPQSFTVQSTDNQALTAISPGFAIGSNSFQQVQGSGTPTDCAAVFSLDPGATCNVSISFIPQTSGGVSSSETFTDNSLNANAAVQAGSLQGGGPIAPTSITINAPSIPYGSNGIVVVTVTSSTGIVTGQLADRSGLVSLSRHIARNPVPNRTDGITGARTWL